MDAIAGGSLMERMVVVAECVSCKARREIAANEMPAGQMPRCKRCGSAMVAIGAQQKVSR
jgi:hypothetical protein